MQFIDVAHYVEDVKALYQRKNREGLTFVQYRVLRVITAKSQAVKDLAEQCRYKQQTVGDIVEELEAMELVERISFRLTKKPSPLGYDRRSTAVRLSNKGIKALERSERWFQLNGSRVLS